MQAFVLVLIMAALLCALVTGLLFGFAIVAMPGLGTLDDRTFLGGFRAMDRIIQNRQPLFMLVWLGSAMAVVAAAAIGWNQTNGPAQTLLIIAAGLYLIGVQGPTAAVNIPLNNRLQAIDPGSMSEGELAEARSWFEARWNRWNRIRTLVAALSTTLLLVVLAIT